MISYRNKKCLVVDDFSEFRSSIKAMLRQIGATDIDVAASGEESIGLCRRKSYDIILHDYNLGPGKDGQQVLEELVLEKLLGPTTIFVMITAETSQAMVMGALEYEPDGYIAKPFNRASLAQRLDKLVERKEAMVAIYSAMAWQDWRTVINACEQPGVARYGAYCLRIKAQAMRELGMLDELDQLLSQILAERPVPWALLAQGRLLFQRGDLMRAQSVYNEAIRLFPMLPALHDALAEVLVAMGDRKAAQKTLDDALKISPRGLRRQMQVGELAKQNKDYERATRAFRDAVDLGRSSCLKSPENYLNLAAMLNVQSAGEAVMDKKVQEEVQRTLAELDRGYGDDSAVVARSHLLQAQTLIKSGKPEDAERYLASAVDKLGDLEQFFPADVALDVAQQLRDMGRAAEADGMLRTCAEMYGDDAAVLKNIEKQTDNPEIFAKANEAKALNREAAKCYEQKDYDRALQLFRKALALQPKNISIALNTAQSLIRLAGDSKDEELREECIACLDSVRMIPPTDHRYDRYQQLRRRSYML